MRWQFWIDVGGTFTDCVALSPERSLQTYKTLSSGKVKGKIGILADRQLQDPIRSGDPAGFWIGWTISFLDSSGRVVFRAEVLEFDHVQGLLTLSNAPPHNLEMGEGYELSCDLEAPIICMRMILGLPLDQPLPVTDVRLGTTRGTNALLERKGARTAFVTTAGFGDLLLIGNQARPELFDLNIQKSPSLYERVIEVQERLDAEGRVLQPLDLDDVRVQLQRAKAAGIESIAIALLHGYRNPQHEAQIEQIAHEIGLSEISRSSLVAPTIKIVPRAETTVLDGYLTPVLRLYVAKIRAALAPESTLKLMTSYGGLVDGTLFTGKDSILSGPAGGVVAFARLGQAAGYQQLIGFDMGGTSTDVSRFGGEFEIQTEATKAGVHIASPTLAIETVAAGGGSICSFDGIQLRVGPESAGADPGPACYGRGGPLTVTDLNVALGRLLPDQFPFPLDLDAVDRRLWEICQQIESTGSKTYSPEELAEGFLQIANETMSRAIRKVSIQKGFHPREHVLVSFGGAGGQHACAMARSLGMQTIFMHPFAGILSAYGMGLADIRKREERSILQRLEPNLLQEISQLFESLETKLQREVEREGIDPEFIQAPQRSLSLRYQGVESTITIVEPEDGDYARAYTEQHEQLFGYSHHQREIEVVTAMTEIVGITSHPKLPSQSDRRQHSQSTRTQAVWFQGRQFDAEILSKSEIQPGQHIHGPTIISELGSTIWIEPGFRCEVQADGSLLIEQSAAEQTALQSVQQRAESSEVDLIQLEIFNHQFASIAEQMGVTLQKTSVSTNVKERLDYSCAIFDSAGGLVVNAPHIPVHLGAMGETVRAILKECDVLNPGDVLVTNDPYAGGSHLPDVTVVTPVHDAENGELLFLTASRAHHAEIGGISPGSMPPFSKNLAEEGVLIRQLKLVEAGQSRETDLQRLLVSGPYPTRNLADNLADIAAQVAANKMGARLLLELIASRGREVVTNYMRHIQLAARQKMERALATIPDGQYRYTDFLDDGSPVAVLISIQGERAVIDFTGTGPVLKTNLNANRAIVTAACLYVFRCLIEETIPLNSGVLEPLNIVLPDCLLNPPRHEDPVRCAAMVGGNVETSQRVVDVLLGALGKAAASQGTMNNLTFGDQTFGYYETIGGGAGATADHDGADAVHTHMTNTRLTDVEVIEHRYPVRLLKFAVRRGSGGRGRHRGGDGIIRIFQFLQPLKVSLLTQRRGVFAPFGLEGASPGAVGRNQVRISNEEEFKDVGGCVQLDLAAGDELSIETPGGGGFGMSDSCSAPVQNAV